MKDLASQNGINQHTLEKIHQNLSKRGNNKNRFALNLLNRLKKEILPLKDIKLSQLVENAILEVE